MGDLAQGFGELGGKLTDTLGPTSTKNIDQSMADSRALMNYFLSQQGQLAAVPGLTGPGYDQTGAGAPSAAPAAPAPAMPPPTAPAPAQSPAPVSPPASTASSGGAMYPGRPAPAPVSSPAAAAPPAGGSWQPLDPNRPAVTPTAATAPGGATATPAQPVPGSAPTGGWRDALPQTGGAAGAGTSPLGVPAGGIGGAGVTGTTAAATAPLAPGIDQTQSNQFRTGQMALAQSIGNSLAGAQPGPATLDESRVLDSRGQQLGLASQLRDAAFSGPSAAPLLDQAAQLEARNRQNNAIGMIQAAAEGRTPSVAEMQGNRQIGQLQSNIMGNAAAMGRGGNTALALRSAIMSAGRLGGDAVANAAMQRAAEQAQSRGQLVNAIEAQRGADIGVAGQNQQSQLATAGQDIQRMATAAGQAGNILGNVAGADLGAAQANQQAAIQNRSQNIAETQGARGQLADVLQTGRAADLNAAQANQQSQITTRGQNIQQTQNQAQNALEANKNQASAAGAQFNAETAQKQQTGNLISTGLGLLSDKRAKEDIKPAKSGMFREFLSAINPSSYRYKGSDRPEIGVVAQDVEKSEVGRAMVSQTPSGKAIDVPRATGALMAALADVNKRVDKLEGRGGRGRKAA